MTNKRSMKSVYIAVLSLFLFVCLLGGRQVLPAFAEERAYTNVLADLQKDEAFSVIDFPEINDPEYENFGSIQVIQIAESESGELYLYTYQPSQKVKPFTATEINMALSETVDGTSLFPLTLLNTNGVFCKYLVNGVIVSSDTPRYYNISSIYRDWDIEVDGESGNDSIKNGKVFAVGKVFRAETIDGNVTYSGNKVDVITILNPYPGFLRYWDGFHLKDILGIVDSTDIHYIAFDTDLPIDTLEEADISYYTQTYTEKTVGGKVTWTYGDEEKQPDITLTGKQDFSNSADGFMGIKYTWKSIVTAEEFKKDSSLSDEAKTELDKTKWVLVFLSTPYRETKIKTGAGLEISRYGTKASKVTILRLQFVTAGNPYNLGAVSDKVTEGDNPSGGALTDALGWLDKLCLWLEQISGLSAKVWKIIICSLPLVIVLPILAAVFPVVGQALAVFFKLIGKGFVCLCKGIVWFICLPFKGIAALVNKIKKE